MVSAHSTPWMIPPHASQTTANSNPIGKRNTSRPVFTSHERALAKSHWSSSSARLHRDSFLPFGSCGLCLNIARDPVSCRRGDIFCRECALSNILTQKKDIKRAQKARAATEEEAAKLKAHEDEQEQARAIQDFELTQAGLDRKKKKGNATETNDEKPIPKVDESNVLALVPATKRKFELDQDELDRIAQEDKIKARKSLEEDKVRYPIMKSSVFCVNALLYRLRNRIFHHSGLRH
jgi:nitric oxide synthase-interacting protein